MVHHVVKRLFPAAATWKEPMMNQYALHRQERRLNLLTFLAGSKIAKEQLKSLISTQFQCFSEI